MVAWIVLRRRQLFAAGLILFLSIMPMVAVGAIISTHWWLVVVLPLIPIVPTCLLAPYVADFRCPRCGDHFFRTLATRVGGERECQHCGIEVGTRKGGT
jgi:hypothetical protein